jgi:hypothetical protein
LVLVRIIGVLPPEVGLPPGALADLPDDEAIRLIEDGFAVPATDRDRYVRAIETRGLIRA